jgi:hypothetical protein
LLEGIELEQEVSNYLTIVRILLKTGFALKMDDMELLLRMFKKYSSRMNRYYPPPGKRKKQT